MQLSYCMSDCLTCHISLIVILLLNCCLVIVIDCIHCIHCIVFYLVSVYNCGLTTVLLKKHLTVVSHLCSSTELTVLTNILTNILTLYCLIRECFVI